LVEGGRGGLPKCYTGVVGECLASVPERERLLSEGGRGDSLKDVEKVGIRWLGRHARVIE